MKTPLGLYGMVIALASLQPVSLAAEEFLGRVVKVNAGNRLEVLRNGQREHIRLYGVACPAGAKGDPARQYMQHLTEARSVYVQPLRPDRRGSTLARVQFIGGVNLSHELMRAGLATWDQKQAPKALKLKWLEQEARRARRGIWATDVAMTNLPRRTTPR